MAILAQVDPPLSPCGGALEDGPSRLLAVPSSFGGWTLLKAGGGLSPIPAAALLHSPLPLRAITEKVKPKQFSNRSPVH